MPSQIYLSQQQIGKNQQRANKTVRQGSPRVRKLKINVMHFEKLVSPQRNPQQGGHSCGWSERPRRGCSWWGRCPRGGTRCFASHRGCWSRWCRLRGCPPTHGQSPTAWHSCPSHLWVPCGLVLCSTSLMITLLLLLLLNFILTQVFIYSVLILRTASRTVSAHFHLLLYKQYYSSSFAFPTFSFLSILCTLTLQIQSLP